MSFDFLKKAPFNLDDNNLEWVLCPAIIKL